MKTRTLDMIVKDDALQNYLTLLGNDHISSILNASQLHYLKNTLGDDTPILSAVSPALSLTHASQEMIYCPQSFKVEDFNTMIIPALYPATLSAIKVTGRDIKEWLEVAASIYQVPCTENSSLLNHTALTFLFYPIAGLSYTIDIDEPPLFNQFGEYMNYHVRDGIFHPNLSKGRINEILYQGRAIGHDEEFMLIASSFAPSMRKWRLEGRTFMDIGSPDNRLVLLEYLKNNPCFEQISTSSWSLKSQLKAGVFLPMPIQNVIVPEYLYDLYDMQVADQEPSGFCINFK